MKLTLLAAAVVVAGMGARAEETTSIVRTLTNPEVMAAMKSIWMQAANGTTNVEATFRLDGDSSDYEVVLLPWSGEFRKQRLEIIPGRTFAVFHVHPNVTDPEPSRPDKSLADKFKMKILTMHIRGLFQYDPATKKTTRIRDGSYWTKRT